MSDDSLIDEAGSGVPFARAAGVPRETAKAPGRRSRPLGRFDRRAAAGWMCAAPVIIMVALGAGLPDARCEDATLTVRWTAGDGGKPTVRVTGLGPEALEALRKAAWETDRWQRMFPVHAGRDNPLSGIGLPPMLGRYKVEPDGLHFEPQFALEPGVVYRATFIPAELPGGSSAPLLSAEHRPAAPSTAPTTTVSQIYPTAAVLPENLLKFYLHFSASMRRGHIYEHIHLRGQDGKDVELPFLEIDEELWNPEMTRLTLFIDPGRIKREVRPLEEIGPSLEAGKSFTLVIDRDWKDASGRPLARSFSKSFTVGPADRNPPDPESWKLDVPKAQTQGAVIVGFPDPMDHALARRLISIAREPEGAALGGAVTLANEERRWTFVPDTPWLPGTYDLVVQTSIEDLAGNNVGKPFEVDVQEPGQRILTRSVVKRRFEVR